MTAVLRAEEPSARYLAQREPSLLRGFELLATADGGTDRIRSLIVSMALNGRLTSEPGRSSPVSGGAWPVVRLSDLAPTFQNGASSRGDAGGVPTTVIRLADITAGEISAANPRVLPIRASDRQKHALRCGDILVIRVNGSADLVGRFIVCRTDMDAIHCDHFIRMRFDPAVIWPEYLRLVGDSASVRGRVASLFVSTAGQKTVNQGHIGSISIALPPIEEQVRIVARVEELMKLCNALEQSGRLADEQHARLTSTLFDALAASESAHALAENWHRVAEHFDLLLDRPEAVDSLETAIRQLAIQGLLASAHDETVLSFEAGLPAWPVVEVGDVARLENGDRSKNYPSKAHRVAAGIPFINAGHLESGTVNFSGMDYISQDRFELLKAGKTKVGDLLFCLRGSLGKAALVNFDGPAAIASSLVIIRPEALLTSEYAMLFLDSPAAKAQIAEFDNGTAQPNLSASSLAKFMFRLPPLAEQHRIVARVEELRRVCASLRERLTRARETQSRLADAMVAEDS